MKSSKSLKNMTIVADRKIQHDLLSVQSPTHSNKYARTTKNKNQQNQNLSKQLPISCKNLTEHIDQFQHKSSLVSAKKHKRQRSSSLQQSIFPQQNRKKQLDCLCLQRIVNQIKRYLLFKKQIWDLKSLCYGQLLRLLWICRYIPYVTQEQFIQNHLELELKKVYLLWLTISKKKYVNFKDFMIIVQNLQNINVQPQKVEQFILSLQVQMNQLCIKTNQNFYEDPHFTFFIKRIQLQRIDSSLVLKQSTKQKIFSQFKSFKFHKLKDSGIYQCVKLQEQTVLVSKKSTQLADQKRKKIKQKIKQKQPHIQNINLLDLLSYRQRDHAKSNKKAPLIKNNKFQQLRTIQTKKQLQLLSKPKPHIQQRKQDQISYSREQQQFTFHPKINPCKISQKDKIMQIKNVDKVLIRMKQARKQKQQKQSIIKKGWCNSNSNKSQPIKSFKKNSNVYTLKTSVETNKQNIGNIEKQNNNFVLFQGQKQEYKKQNKQNRQNKKVCKYQVSKDYLKIPILYIDVNIQQGKKQRIIIYDNDKAQDLAKQFGIKHKLTQQTISRLQLLLQKQMDTVLARIDQQTQDDCSLLY